MRRQSLLAASRDLKESGMDWAGYLGVSFSAGAALGTLLDGIHSRVGLQVRTF